MKKTKEKLGLILPYISLSQIAQQYFCKSRSWMYHKLNEDIVNNTQYQFNDSEIETLILALENIGNDISKAISELNTTKNIDSDFPVYIGDEYADNYLELKKNDLSEYRQNYADWKFNDPNGTIGVKCIDSQKGENISFFNGNLINPKTIKDWTRIKTRISGLPENIDLNKFIEECNNELLKYRNNTKDTFLTSLKGLRKDGKHRRRIGFKTIRAIMNKTLDKLKS